MESKLNLTWQGGHAQNLEADVVAVATYARELRKIEAAFNLTYSEFAHFLGVMQDPSSPTGTPKAEHDALKAGQAISVHLAGAAAAARILSAVTKSVQVEVQERDQRLAAAAKAAGAR